MNGMKISLRKIEITLLCLMNIDETNKSMKHMPGYRWIIQYTFFS